MSVTDGIAQIPCSFEHNLVFQLKSPTPQQRLHRQTRDLFVIAGVLNI